MIKHTAEEAFVTKKISVEMNTKKIVHKKPP